MKTRILSLVASALVSASVCAQTGVESRVQEVFASLRSSASLWVRTEGSESIGNRTTLLGSDLHWSAAFGQPARVELLDYRGGTQVARLVGDSVVLWTYDNRRNQYSTARYGDYMNPNAANTSSLLQSLASFSSPASLHAARLLREVFGGDAAIYRHWVTGNAPFMVQNGQPTYVDPISGRRFIPNPDLDFVVFTQGNPVRRSTIFERFRSSTSAPWSLSAIYVSELDDLRGRSRLLDLKLSLYPDQLPTTASFNFTPPAGARAVARTRPGG